MISFYKFRKTIFLNVKFIVIKNLNTIETRAFLCFSLSKGKKFSIKYCNTIDFDEENRMHIKMAS